MEMRSCRFQSNGIMSMQVICRVYDKLTGTISFREEKPKAVIISRNFSKNGATLFLLKSTTALMSRGHGEDEILVENNRREHLHYL